MTAAAITAGGYLSSVLLEGTAKTETSYLYAGQGSTNPSGIRNAGDDNKLHGALFGDGATVRFGDLRLNFVRVDFVHVLILVFIIALG